MATIINLCGSVGANTGKIDCDPRRANFKSIIVGGAQFDSTQYGTPVAFQAAFQTAMNLATGASGKLYPFPEFVGVNVNTEANKEATFGNGQKITLAEGRPTYIADLRIGTNLERQLRKFNGQVVPVWAFDDAGNVWGKKNAAAKFVGYQAEIFVAGAGFGDYNNAQFTRVTISFQSASDFYDYAAFVPTDFDVTNLEGLLDVELFEAAVSATNVRKIGVRFVNAQLGANQNIYDNYDTELAVGSLWKATNLTTGAAITITSVAIDATLKAFTLTLDTTMWTALTSGTKVEIDLVDPPALVAAGVTGIEALPLVITK